MTLTQSSAISLHMRGLFITPYSLTLRHILDANTSRLLQTVAALYSRQVRTAGRSDYNANGRLPNRWGPPKYEASKQRALEYQNTRAEVLSHAGYGGLHKRPETDE